VHAAGVFFFQQLRSTQAKRENTKMSNISATQKANSSVATRSAGATQKNRPSNKADKADKALDDYFKEWRQDPTNFKQPVDKVSKTGGKKGAGADFSVDHLQAMLENLKPLADAAAPRG
jgi:hypothetical protein